jgi:hypothetical protein
MKRILILAMVLVVPLMGRGQLIIRNLPEDNTVDPTDLLLVSDKGQKSKKMTMNLLFDSIRAVIHDTSAVQSGEIDDFYATLLSLIGAGTPGWSQGTIATRLYPTNPPDSIIIGGTVPTAKLDIVGNVRFRNNIYMGTAGYGFSLSGVTTTLNTKLALSNDLSLGYLKKVIFGYGADVSCYIDRDGAGNLVFHDGLAGDKTLSELMAGGGGGGVVDTFGGQATNYLAYWKTASVLAGTSGLQYNGTLLSLTGANAEIFDITTTATTTTPFDINATSLNAGYYLADITIGSGNGPKITFTSGEANKATGTSGYAAIYEVTTGTGVASQATTGDCYSGVLTGTGGKVYYGEQYNGTFMYGVSTGTGDLVNFKNIGGTSIFQIDYLGNTYLRTYNDADTGIVYITPAGKLIYDSIAPASWQIKNTPLFWKYFLDRKNGEFLWPRFKGDTIRKLKPVDAFTQLQAGNERHTVWFARRDVWMFLLTIAVVYLLVQNYRIKKRLSKCEKY